MRKLLMSLLISSLASCASLPDVPICMEVEPDKARCNYTITDKPFYWDDETLLEGDSYWEGKPKLLLLPPSSWAEIKAYILKRCEQYGNCSVVDKIDKLK